MRISEVRVKLTDDDSDRLKAFCTITCGDEFIIRDIKVIAAPTGYFIAMPSRKINDRCPQCSGKNHLQAKYCNTCGTSLPANRASKDPQGRLKLYADIVHPINTRCRQEIQREVLQAFQQELKRSHRPNYRPVDMDCD